MRFNPIGEGDPLRVTLKDVEIAVPVLHGDRRRRSRLVTAARLPASHPASGIGPDTS